MAFAVEPGNFETAFKLGETYRYKSMVETAVLDLRDLENPANWESLTNAMTEAGTEPFAVHARKGATWYERVLKLNPYHASAHAGLALCLDDLYEFEAAEKHIQLANELDPNGMTTCTLIGMHYLKRAGFQDSGYAIALPWFVRSIQLRLVRRENLAAFEYIPVCERQLLRAARLPEFSRPSQ
jgi:tetratricopeptide (TPR) repeat protein